MVWGVRRFIVFIHPVQTWFNSQPRMSTVLLVKIHGRSDQACRCLLGPKSRGSKSDSSPKDALLESRTLSTFMVQADTKSESCCRNISLCWFGSGMKSQPFWTQRCPTMMRDNSSACRWVSKQLQFFSIKTFAEHHVPEFSRVFQIWHRLWSMKSLLQLAVESGETSPWCSNFQDLQAWNNAYMECRPGERCLTFSTQSLRT